MSEFVMITSDLKFGEFRDHASANKLDIPIIIIML